MAKPKKIKTIPINNGEKVRQVERRTKLLPHYYSPAELEAKSLELAKLTLDIESQLEIKKAEAKKHDGIIKPLQRERTALSFNVNQGYETREVECEIEYHTPRNGYKRTTRMDTMDSSTEEMVPEDFTIFTQPTEDIDHDDLSDEDDMPDEGKDGEDQPLLDGPKEGEEDKNFPDNL